MSKEENWFDKSIELGNNYIGLFSRDEEGLPYEERSFKNIKQIEGYITELQKQLKKYKFKVYLRKQSKQEKS